MAISTLIGQNPGDRPTLLKLPQDVLHAIGVRLLTLKGGGAAQHDNGRSNIKAFTQLGMTCRSMRDALQAELQDIACRPSPPYSSLSSGVLRRMLDAQIQRHMSDAFSAIMRSSRYTMTWVIGCGIGDTALSVKQLARSAQEGCNVEIVSGEDVNSLDNARVRYRMTPYCGTLPKVLVICNVDQKLLSRPHIRCMMVNHPCYHIHIILVSEIFRNQIPAWVHGVVDAQLQMTLS